MHRSPRQKVIEHLYQHQHLKHQSDQARRTNKNAASEVGKLIAERALSVGIKDVSFDRSGYKYHGRVKALADSAREVGLKF